MKNPILIRVLKDIETVCNNDLAIIREIKHISLQFISNGFIYNYFQNPERMEKNMFFIFVDHVIADKLKNSMYALSYNFIDDSSKTIIKNEWHNDKKLNNSEKSELLRMVMEILKPL